ncbi:kinase-like domain-containing protein [Xylariales sp. AK1849]|nr:kinase-like domain-containing protein [Xylariales sp. AK1849]
MANPRSSLTCVSDTSSMQAETGLSSSDEDCKKTELILGSEADSDLSGEEDRGPEGVQPKSPENSGETAIIYDTEPGKRNLDSPTPLKELRATVQELDAPIKDVASSFAPDIHSWQDKVHNYGRSPSVTAASAQLEELDRNWAVFESKFGNLETQSPVDIDSEEGDSQSSFHLVEQPQDHVFSQSDSGEYGNQSSISLDAQFSDEAFSMSDSESAEPTKAISTNDTDGVKLEHGTRRENTDVGKEDSQSSDSSQDEHNRERTREQTRSPRLNPLTKDSEVDRETSFRDTQVSTTRTTTSSDEFYNGPGRSIPQKRALTASDTSDKRPIKQYQSVESLNLENVEDYVEGGYHPVHIEDVLDGRFEVVAKLGHGGFATVWLCFHIQSKKWRAVKILQADFSKNTAPDLKIINFFAQAGVQPHQWETAHIQLPIDQFWLEGSNGRHLCLVLPLLGPMLKSKEESDVDTIKRLLKQAGEGLKLLHECGICHGDFRPDNILLRLSDTDHISKEEMVALLGQPATEDVERIEAKGPGPRAPRYLVEPADLACLGVKDEVAIVDFGVSFQVSNPPTKAGIPDTFAAPEACFNYKLGCGSDLWAFVCTIADVRTRGFLFAVEGEEWLKSVEYILGPLPEPYRSVERVKDWVAETYQAKPEVGIADADILLQPVTRSLKELEMERESRAKRFGYKDPLQEVIARDRGGWFIPQGPHGEPNFRTGRMIHKPFKIPDEEVVILSDLLSRVLKYNPEERIDIHEFLQHVWFRERKAIATQTDQVTYTEASTQPDLSPCGEAGTQTHNHPHAEAGTQTNHGFPVEAGAQTAPDHETPADPSPEEEPNTFADRLEAEERDAMRRFIPPKTRHLLFVGFTAATALWLLLIAYLITSSLVNSRSPEPIRIGSSYEPGFVFAQTRRMSSTSTFFEGLMTFPEHAQLENGQERSPFENLGFESCGFKSDIKIVDSESSEV